MESKLVDPISNLKIDNDHADKPTSEFQAQPQSTPADHHHHHHQQETQQPNNIVPDIPTPSKESRKTTSSTKDEQFSNNKDEGIMDDDDDGYKTPTGPEHKIPVMTECPPAPRRRVWKRKLYTPPSPPGGRRIRVEVPEPLEVLFTPLRLNVRPEMMKMMKRVRRK